MIRGNRSGNTRNPAGLFAYSPWQSACVTPQKSLELWGVSPQASQMLIVCG
jgi:hypothetical protein